MTNAERATNHIKLIIQKIIIQDLKNTNLK